MNLYIASCVKTGGIYHYKRTGQGSLELVEKTPLDRPMYMIIRDGKMYVVLKAPFENGESGILTLNIEEDGRLTNPSEIVSAQGVEGCHIAVHENRIYCANYTSGNVIMLPEASLEGGKEDGAGAVLVRHSGCGPHPARQKGPHTHFVGMTPDEKYLCVTDLGLDTIFLYHPDLTLHASFRVPAGQGVRHLAFSEDGRYLFAANELGSTVTVFAYRDGELTFLDQCSALPADYADESAIAAIRIKDSLIYVSNRGHDSIAVLEFADEKLYLLATYPCGGSFPRDFVFAGDDIICTNQLGNNVTVLDGTDQFRIVQELQMEEPLCVCIG